MNPSTAIIIGAILATFGWIYTGRRGRTLAKKQHTITVMMKANFDAEFLKARSEITNYIKGTSKLPDDFLTNDKYIALGASVRRVINHYEFVAAGLRNGDLDERLVKDSERSTFVMVYVNMKDYIWSLRNGRDRMTIYEHLEWLHNRWEECPPSKIVRLAEWIKGTPFYGKKNRAKS